jgi:hypothetical protein
MADEWGAYKVQNTDDWSQYAVKTPTPSGATPGGIMGAGIGIGAGALGAYALAKSGIPQAGIRAVDYLAKGAMNLPKVMNTNKSADFAQKVRGEFVLAHKNQVDKFGAEITKLAKSNPNKLVDISDFVNEIQTDPGLPRDAMNVFKRTPKLDRILKNNKLTNEVNLKDVQEMINYLNTKVPKDIKSTNLDVLDAISTLKGKQLDAFPEMEGIRADYAKFIQPYKNLKTKFKYNQILKAIENKFGGAEGMADMEKILPKALQKEMRNYRAGQKLTNIPKAIPLLGRLFTFAPQIMQAIDFQRQMDEAKKKGGMTIDDFGNVIPLSKEDLAI